jgi:hypothetical protein
MENGIVRYSSDWRSLAFVAVALFLHAWALVASPSHLLTSAALILALALFAFAGCVINHNHQHLPIFRRRRNNVLFNCALTLAKGHTATQIVVPHQLNHHVHDGGAEDWIRMSLVDDAPGGAARILFYIFRASRSMRGNRSLAGAPRLHADQALSLRIERALLYAWLILGLCVNWRSVLVFWLPAWLFAMLFLVAVNLFQHDGCSPGSEFSGSRNFTGRIFNWFLFNNGFHTVHHRQGALHWSLARLEHVKIVDRIPPELNERSLVGFILKRYFGFGSLGLHSRDVRVA